MADIAARAGLAVGTLYNHFRDREALLTTLLDNHHNKLLGELDATLAECDEQPFADQLRSVLTSFFVGFERYRPLVESLVQANGDLPSVSKRPKVMREVYSRFEILAKRGLAQQVLDVQLARLLPTLLLGTARTVLVAPLLAGAPKMRPSDVDLLIKFFLNGASAQTGAQS